MRIWLWCFGVDSVSAASGSLSRSDDSCSSAFGTVLSADAYSGHQADVLSYRCNVEPPP